ncbi:hypothetical protein ABZP36_008883 [Zizania latifolia]
MCPLWVILIFLSATIAGFFLIRGLNGNADNDEGTDSPKAPAPLNSKVGSAVRTGFWTVVDMASGKCLWRTLVSPSIKCESKKSK